PTSALFYTSFPTRRSSDLGTNPLSSCLPLLLQMPIFFGLFSVLQHAQNQNAENPAGVGLLNAELSASFGTSDLWGAPLHLAISTDRKSTRLNSSHVKISYA